MCAAASPWRTRKGRQSAAMSSASARASVPPETAECRAQPVLSDGAPGMELVAGRGPHGTFGIPAGEALHDREVERRAITVDRPQPRDLLGQVLGLRARHD